MSHVKPLVLGADAPSAQTAIVQNSSLDALTLLGSSLYEDLPDFETARLAYRLSMPLSKVPDDVECHEISVGDCRAEWFFPPNAELYRRLLYLHGGGYVMGSDLTAHRAMIAYIAKHSRCVVMALDYRKAPEHPFPAALDDSLAAYEYLLAETQESSKSPDRIYVGGDSAGGGLTLATALALKARQNRLPDALFAIGPWVKLPAGELRNIAVDKSETVLAESYAGSTNATNPLISPIYGDFGGLPPLLLHVGEDFDTDWTQQIADKAHSDGVQVTFEQWRHMGHVWHMAAPFLPEANDAIKRIGLFLNDH